MKYIFLVNPAAGQKNRSEDWTKKIEQTCEARGVDYEIHRTEGVGDAREYVKKRCASADDELRFYACGGDGTVNEVANGAVGCERAAVGILPIGTGNDFVRNFEGNEAFLDIDAQLDGTEVPIDLLKLDDTYSVNMVNIGFDCEVVRRVAKIKTHPWIPSGMAYLAGVLKTLIRKPGVSMDLAADDEEVRHADLLLCAIGNGAWCGGGYFSAPLASLRDGQMEVIRIKNVSRRRFLSLVNEYKTGTYMTGKASAYVEYGRCSRLDLRFNKEQAICVDGEVIFKNEIRFSVERNAIRVVVPRGAKLTASAAVCPEESQKETSEEPSFAEV